MRISIKKRQIPVTLTALLLVIFCFLSLPVSGAVMNGDDAVCDTAEGGVYGRLRLCPGGMCFGVTVKTRGVPVVGFSSVGGEGKSPAELAGVRIKDVIVKVNGEEVNTCEEIGGIVAKSEGNDVVFTLKRGNDELEVRLKPIRSAEDGLYKAGVWIRDSTAGIGTVTVINPLNGSFAGLGHGICDSDTGLLMPLLSGSVSDVSISSVRKGRAGAPGELKGYFGGKKTGALLGNTASGVYGLFTDEETHTSRETLPVASGGEVVAGSAYIYCTSENNKTDKYSVKILRIQDPYSDSKNLIVELDDKRLLEQTGGIVQGMSGSPIIQNGKIVGAITHVMVNEPTKGYGILIENMLEKMPELCQTQ